MRINHFWFQITVALFIRLALMPFTLHGDLIFTNYFPYFLSHHGVWDIYGYFGDHFIQRSGYSFYAPLVYYVVGFSQWIFKILCPWLGFDDWMAGVHAVFYPGTFSGIADFFSSF